MVRVKSVDWLPRPRRTAPGHAPQTAPRSGMWHAVRLWLALSAMLMGGKNLHGQEPNFVRTTVYAHDMYDESVVEGDRGSGYVHGPLLTTTYSDGTGKVTQTHVQLAEYVDSGYDAIVTEVGLDEIGRPCTTFKATPLKTDGLFLREHDEVVERIMSYHADADGYAFSQKVFWPDPNSRERCLGAPGRDFSADESAGGHPGKKWYVGTKFGVSGKDWFSADGLAKIVDRDPASDERLDSIASSGPQPDEVPEGLLQDPTHFLTVVRDPNGSYQQEIKDLWGRVVVRSSKHERQENTYRAAIVSRHEYDPMGKLRREIPPVADNGDELISPSTYTYDELSQMIRTVTPDAGLVTRRYDEMGRLVAVVDNKDRDAAPDACDTLKYAHDAFGRVVRVYKVRSTMPGRYWIKVVKVYDHPEAVLDYVKRAELRTLLTEPAQVPRHTRGRLVATLSYGEFCEPCADSTGKTCEWNEEPVVSILSYNEAGLVERRIVGIPGIPVQRFSFTYDLQGKPLQRIYDNGTRTIVSEYTYDENGKLDTLIRDGRRIAASTYSPVGMLRERYLLTSSSDGPPSVAGSLRYSYMERDWLKQLSLNHKGETVFSEKLYYQGYPGMATADGQFNGNISRTRYTGQGSNYPSIDLCYRYDEVDRLTAARNGIGRFGENPTDGFDAEYVYDNAGRIERFFEEPSHYNATGPYKYGAVSHDTGTGTPVTMNSSRLAGIPGVKDESENYLYGPNGNLVFDKSKAMAIVYDWRNLPVRFKFYAGYPEDVTPETCTSLEKPADGETAYRLLTYVDMRYDANGQRVLKQEYVP